MPFHSLPSTEALQQLAGGKDIVIHGTFTNMAMQSMLLSCQNFVFNPNCPPGQKQAHDLSIYDDNCVAFPTGLAFCSTCNTKVKFNPVFRAKAEVSSLAAAVCKYILINNKTLNSCIQVNNMIMELTTPCVEKVLQASAMDFWVQDMNNPGYVMNRLKQLVGQRIMASVQKIVTANNVKFRMHKCTIVDMQQAMQASPSQPITPSTPNKKRTRFA